MRRSEAGNTVLEFTLVGIPLMFVLISIFELARGMWIYHTLAHAIKESTRFSAVHGQNCAISPNACAVTVRQVATRIRDTGVGLIPNEFQNITLNSTSRTVTCPKLNDCLIAGALGDTYWPTSTPGTAPDPGSATGLDIWIYGEYPFRSAIALVWPGAGSINFPMFVLPAYSRERIYF